MSRKSFFQFIRFLKIGYKSPLLGHQTQIIMKQIFWSCILTIGVLSTANSQKFDQGETYGVTYKQMLKAADEAFNIDKDYYTAMRYYGLAMNVRSNDTGLRYKYAESARLAGAFILARDAYQTVSKAEDKDKFPLTQYWLGYIYQVLGKYTDAIERYDKFLTTQQGNEAITNYYLQLATRGIKDAKWSRDIAEVQHNVKVLPIGDEINTPNKEFGSFMLNDTLYYSSLNFQSNKDNAPTERPYARILFSVDGSKGEQLTDGINDTLRHTANLVYNTKRTQRFFTRCDYLDNRSAEIRCAIFTQKKQRDGSWSSPEKLNNHINNKEYTYTHPSVAQDSDTKEEYLYFASDQPNGKGKLDIWVAKINEEGDLEQPENLEVVNTTENEVTPFFHSPTQTLYYSTEGLLGLGGFDIQKVKKAKDGWGEVENMGKPINSSLNDLYFTLNEDGSKGYLSSNREGSTYMEKEYQLCCDDIFAAEFDIKVELLAYIFNNVDQSELLGASIRLLEVKEDGSLEEIAKQIHPLDNAYQFFVDRDSRYVLESSKDGFVKQMDTIFIPLTAPDQIKKDIYLSPVTADLKVLTYDMETKLPITSINIQLIEVDGDMEKVVQEQLNEYGNDFKFPLELDKTYVIRATKPGYQPVEELELNTFNLKNSEVFLAELYLRRISFGDYLPLAIYFDNDYPNRKSNSRTTDISYAETVEDYYDKKEEFKLLFTEPMDKEEAFLTAERYEAFFEREVKRGFDDLTTFADALLQFLERGNEVRIQLRGYASPRSNPTYNYNLSARRIVSVQNFFRSYKGGVLMTYINQKKLIVEQEPIGDKTAPNYVIGLLEDERNSIYSLGASLERRVEIVEVEVKVTDEEVLPSSKAFSTKGGNDD